MRVWDLGHLCQMHVSTCLELKALRVACSALRVREFGVGLRRCCDVALQRKVCNVINGVLGAYRRLFKGRPAHEPMPCVAFLSDQPMYSPRKRGMAGASIRSGRPRNDAFRSFARGPSRFYPKRRDATTQNGTVCQSLFRRQGVPAGFTRVL